MIEIVEVLLKKEKLEAEAGISLPYVFHGKLFKLNLFIIYNLLFFLFRGRIIEIFGK